MKKVNIPPMQLNVKKLVPEAKLPTKGSLHAAGYDLYASKGTKVDAKQKILVSTGISMEIPEGCYGRIAPRSGLAVKNFIDVGAGVIDSDYRGEVKVLLFNFSSDDFEVKEGDRIAQLIIEYVAPTNITEITELNETSRGEGGFGSTGTN